ncbi:hypothetical protein OG500_26280 [Kitasatospora sp. NBC_01250]|uniref:hypothetical protein n=1 Tax=Kitasatospora sp. NBC_01250 TaxID=2903571 RepID=UPI002E38086E|nr:hypothetical protein [Kitasatospora sp. NBC_01250]
MFEVRRSIRRLRQDPHWEHRRRATAADVGLGTRGYPFTLGSGTDRLYDLARGQVAGRDAVLAHLLVAPAAPSRGGALHDFSLVALDLPRALPATAVTPRRLAAKWRGERSWPIPPGLWQRRPLPGGGPGAHVERVCADYEFGELLITDRLKQLTVAADCGWRIDGARLIGWTDGRRPYEELIALAERLDLLVAAFPAAVWQWRGWS